MPSILMQCSIMDLTGVQALASLKEAMKMAEIARREGTGSDNVDVCMCGCAKVTLIPTMPSLLMNLTLHGSVLHDNT